MNRISKLLFIFWAFISLIVIIYIAIFDFQILNSAESLQVQYTPDDAYYYLILARNFPVYKNWTVDAGNSLTSGFHPLLVYVLTLLYKISNPTSREFIHLSLILSSLITLLTFLLMWFFGLRKGKLFWMLSLTLLVSSKPIILTSVSMMESSFVLLISSIYWIYYLLHMQCSRKKDLIILFSIGLIGSLSRTDFGVHAFSILLASLIFHHYQNKGRIISFSLAGLLGVVFGLLLTLFHNHLFTGEFLQSSARMKAYWIQILGSNFYTFKLLLDLYGLDFIDYRYSGVFLVFLAFISLCLLVLIGEKLFELINFLSDNNTSNSYILLATTICLLGYILLYSWSGSIQIWYVSNLFLPAHLFLVTLLQYLNNILKRISSNLQTVFQLISSFIVPLIIFRNIWLIFPINEKNSPWPHQEIMQNAGNYLHQYYPDEKIGSWNAGIIGYYQGGTVVNIDGLVNNDIYKYATTNTLLEYVKKKDIQYIIDFDNMFEDSDRRRKGGYDDRNFLDSLYPIKKFDNGIYQWKNLTLYSIIP